MSVGPALARLTGEFGERDRLSVGGKAVGLATLLRAGLAVPDTWVVPVGTEPDGRQLRALAAVGRSWAVRSSATAEDGAALSYAGMFSSELDVPADDLAAAIGRVRLSVDTGRVAAYRQRAGPRGPAARMAVLLQPFQRPAQSGLWLGRCPGQGRLEWVAGSGDALVSGTLTPHWEEWTAAGQADGSGREPLTCGGQPVGEACLRVQAALGELADLEFAILDAGRLVWLQFRPVTAGLGAAHGQPASSGRRLVRGTAAAGGRATGRTWLLSDPGDPRWEPDGVLLTERTDPDWVPLMTEAAALVTAEGGMLCHTAIVARELGVPCVTGVGMASLRRLAVGRVVNVDGTAGTVTVLDGAPGVP